jgi:hypothetical protein
MSVHLERFRQYTGGHNEYVLRMTGEEVKRELYYLLSGAADLRDSKGVSQGLPPELVERKKELEYSIFATHDITRSAMLSMA